MDIKPTRDLLVFSFVRQSTSSHVLLRHASVEALIQRVIASY
nr:hypothetical protein [Candidatus Sigynarchaeota archaeon]